MIRVGEAALTLDPLSSTGVEKALQGGAVAAAYVHTLLRHPDRSEACARFVRARHEETARVHARWTRGHYAEVTRFADRPFWQARAAAREDATANASREAVHIPALDSPMRLSPLLRLVEEPCLVHDEIDLRVSVQHPRLTRPVAFVDGVALAPLLDIVHDGITMGDVITQWSRVMPPNSLRHMVEWCVEQDLLEQMPAS
jgi:hypothetical protein